MKNLLYVMLLFTGLSAFAQETYTISGTVDDSKGMAVPGVTVFITGSKYITATNGEGKFSFNNIQPGTYEVTFKMLGFDPVMEAVTVRGKSAGMVVRLKETNVILNTVTIQAKSIPEKNRANNMQLFIDNFIGQTVNAEQCKILNPEILHFRFDKDKKTLSATAGDFIVIENKALGYTVKYLLTQFALDLDKHTCATAGSPYFEELKGTAAQQRKWDNNRRLAYLSSNRHFFKAVMNNTATQEGYAVYRFNDLPGSKGLRAARQLNIDSLFMSAGNNFKALISNPAIGGNDTTRAPLYVVYTGEKQATRFYKTGQPINLKFFSKQSQVSELKPLADTILIDNNGSTIPKRGFMYYDGYWEWEKIADLTPLDYFVVGPQAATGEIKAVIASLDSFRNRTPIEKIHIHFDKPYYSLGDTLWMKVYVVNENNGLSPLSKIVYADLTDDKGSVKASLKLPLTQGLGWGALTLSDSLLHEGIYHIRAYTTLMRNFDAGYFFDKTIRISGNPLNPSAALLLPSEKAVPAVKGAGQPPAGPVSVKFFPEGGDLVAGLFSRVAFKAIGSDGLSRAVSGIVVDKDNKQVADFRSEHAGMGLFMLQPVAGNTYTAIVKLPDSSLERVALPAALQQGYGLSVNQNADNVFVSIAASNALLKNGEVSLVAQAGNVVRYSGKSDLAHGGVTTIIPKSRFPEGIVQFTLFSPRFQPVAERLVFIHNTDNHLNIKVTPDKAGYQPRDKVNLNLAVTNQDGKPVTGSFSMAVTDEGALPYNEADETTIFSNLLLTSNLKGYIEHPNYYFTGINTDKEQQLDNLLLTQGWRRFVWQDILANTFPALAYQPEGGMGLSGRVLTNKGQPAPGAKVYILFNTRGGTLIDTVADAQGRFNFGRLVFDKGLSYNLSATNAKGKKNVKVEFDKTVVVPPVVNLMPDEQPTEEKQPAYAANAAGQAASGQQQAGGAMPGNRGNELNTPPGQKKPIALKEVTINERKEDVIKKLAFQGSANKAGYADYKFTFVDLAKTNDLGNFLAIQTQGITIQHGNRHGFASEWIAFAPHPFGPGFARYQVIVDGQIDSVDQYSNILPQDIAGIEIIKDSNVNNTTAQGSAGSIVITLKKPGVNYSKYIDEHELDQAKAKATALAQKKAEQEKTINLKEVTIQANEENKIKKIALQGSKNPAGDPAFDDAIFTFVDLAKANDLGAFLTIHPHGLQVVRTIRPPGWRATYDASNMQVIVNGRPESADEYSTITPDQIAAIEIIKGSQAGNVGKGVYGGSINITLKSGNVNYTQYIDEAEEKVQKSIMLKEISVKEKKLDASIKAVAVQFSQNLAGPGNADQVLTFIDLLGCQSDLSQCLNGRLNNVSFKGDPRTGLVPYSRGFDAPMLIVVDGVQGRSLSDIQSSDVASVEVLRGGGAAALYGMHAENGVLIITTKHAGVDYTKYEMEHYVPGYTKPALVLVTYKFQEGYDPRREFYSPDYDNPATNKQMADQRTTIYWKPNIITDENGKASVSFFNADSKGSYRIITEGLDGLGKLGREVDRYAVK